MLIGEINTFPIFIPKKKKNISNTCSISQSIKIKSATAFLSKRINCYSFLSKE